MDDLWRFRQIQSNICPVCSTSHFPFCPPPPAFGFLTVDGPRCFAPDFNPPPFHRPVQEPSLLDHRNHHPPFPPLRDPNPPFHPSARFLHEEFLERDGFRKRMRVEDPYPFPSPPPQHQRTSLNNNERMLSLIREHGRQNSAPVSDHSFNPVSIQQNHYLQADSFDGYRRFDDFPRPRGLDRFLPPERRDFYGGEVETVRTFSSQIGSSFDRLEEKYVNRFSDETHFPDSRSPFACDRPFYPNESSALPKQPQYRQSEYPHSESYHVEPKVANDEQETHYPLPYPSLRPLLEDNIQVQNHPLPYPNMRPTLEGNVELRNQQRTHFEPKPPVFDEIRKPFEPHINPVPYESNDYRMDSAVISRASHTSQMYPPLPPQPPLPPPPEPSPPPHFQEKPAPPPMPSSVPIASLAPLFPTQPATTAPLFPTQPATTTPLFPTQPTTSAPLFPTQPATTARLFPTQPTTSAPLFPTQPTTSAPLFPTQPNSQSFSESRLPTWSSFDNDTAAHTSTGFAAEGLPFIHPTPSKEYMEGRGQAFPPGRSLKVKPTVIDACDLFRQPNRASRPDHIVVILRGLPGSGKSYLAKALRDLEVESGGNAPRIHAMDDYFMIEVEKVEENEGSKSSGSSRGKKQIAKKVIEYCYEPEMEEAYRSSMLKAFKKTLDEGNFTFIIVDDRNLRVADFAQFWAIAKRSGYEVYLLEASYKDPTGCSARNVHGFTVEDIQKMAEQWEEASSLYLQLDIQSLFRGDNLNEQSIQEVDMDTDDAVCDEEKTNKLQQSEEMKTTEPISSDHTLDGGFVKIGERWNADEEEEELTGVKDLGSSKWSKELAGVKDLGSSKWSKDVDEDIGNSDGAGRHMSALSGLIQAYGKSGKCVHWGDQVEQSGFLIGAVKKQSRSSLIIGPGSGYNLNSNPVQEDDGASQPTGRSNINESKRRFTERLRAERESFKAVFDRRKQRIGGLWDAEDE